MNLRELSWLCATRSLLLALISPQIAAAASRKSHVVSEPLVIKSIQVSTRQRIRTITPPHQHARHGTRDNLALAQSWHIVSMNRYQPGSNQYKKRTAPQPLTAPLHITTPIQNTVKRCGEVWGTKCKAKVQAPSWAHGAHPSDNSKLHAALTPHTPTALLLTLANGKASYSVIKTLAKRNNSTEKLKQAIAMRHPLEAMSIWGTNASLLPPDWLEAFAKHPDSNVRANVARLAYLPHHICRLLLKNADENVKVNLASNSVPQTVASALLQDSTITVKSAALRHLGTPNDITTDIIHHSSPEIRAAASYRSNTPSQLDQLIHDSVYSVWHTAVRNPYTTTESLSWIIEHQPLDRIPKAILTHPHCPPDIFSRDIQWTDTWKTALIRFPGTPQTY